MAKIRSTRPLWVDVAEASRLLNKDRRFILRLVEDGKLRSREDLGTLLIRYDDLDHPLSPGSSCSNDPYAGEQLAIEAV
jgi:excisionase family DNA binding protein